MSISQTPFVSQDTSFQTGQRPLARFRTDFVVVDLFLTDPFEKENFT